MSINISPILQAILSIINEELGLSILIISIIISLFIMMLYLVIYLHSIKDNKPVDKSLEKYYKIVSMINIVIIGLLIIRMFFNINKIKNIFNSKHIIFILIVLSTILTVFLYNYIIINKGEKLKANTIIINLIIIYPFLILLGLGLLMIVLSLLYNLIFRFS
jgi:hypothetical protein